MGIEEELNNLFAHRVSGPFLFLGSGFSRRYMGLEDWEGLLSQFCVMGKPYAYYKSSANGDIPTSARLIAEDFHDLWWGDTLYEESRNRYEKNIVNKSSPLRYEISKYLINKTIEKKNNLEFEEEIELLKACDVDGIITTNWDTLIEHIFEDYSTYIGQQELLFSNTYNIGEIYKIHGCSTKPNSLVLTDGDYYDYNSRNAYLASKLITIFVEHPVIFIGYSISDENIRSLLKSISLCIGTDKLEKLRDNLIFLDRNEPSNGPVIETSHLHFDNVQVPVKIIKISDYSHVYRAIHSFERKLPARVLRFCKEKVYEIVQSQDPQTKLAVIDYDKIKDKEDIEIVLGLGVIGKVGETGYRSFTLKDIFDDVVYNNKNFSPDKILNVTVKQIGTKCQYIPIFKYFNQMNINDEKSYIESGIDLDFYIRKDFPTTFCSGNEKLFEKFKNMTFRQFKEQASENAFLTLTPYHPNVDLDILENYIKDNYKSLMNNNKKYFFRKLICFYDWLKYGFI
ncbi:TPA: SIR2 family protein [Klebsiella michiganensis]|nr:SIR2 family protein [Klebsiella michiganensis]